MEIATNIFAVIGIFTVVVIGGFLIYDSFPAPSGSTESTPYKEVAHNEPFYITIIKKPLEMTPQNAYHNPNGRVEYHHVDHYTVLHDGKILSFRIGSDEINYMLSEIEKWEVCELHKPVDNKIDLE